MKFWILRFSCKWLALLLLIATTTFNGITPSKVLPYIHSGIREVRENPHTDIWYRYGVLLRSLTAWSQSWLFSLCYYFAYSTFHMERQRDTCMQIFVWESFIIPPTGSHYEIKGYNPTKDFLSCFCSICIKTKCSEVPPLLVSVNYKNRHAVVLIIKSHQKKKLSA